jgi:hypothetical protein
MNQKVSPQGFSAILPFFAIAIFGLVAFRAGGRTERVTGRRSPRPGASNACDFPPLGGTGACLGQPPRRGLFTPR